MGDKNFMEAGTEIDALVSKKEQCLEKISNVLAEACITRAKNGKINSLENDIKNVISQLPDEDKIVVLEKLAVILSSQISGGKSSINNDRDYSKGKRNDIFAHRSF